MNKIINLVLTIKKLSINNKTLIIKQRKDGLSNQNEFKAKFLG